MGEHELKVQQKKEVEQKAETTNREKYFIPEERFVIQLTRRDAPSDETDVKGVFQEPPLYMRRIVNRQSRFYPGMGRRKISDQ